MKSGILAVAALAVLSGVVEPAVGETVQCGRMQAELAELNDGALFYRPHFAPKSVTWTRLTGTPPIDGTQPTKVDFIYVAREWLPEGRPGMVVIKSGRMLGKEPVPPGPEMIGLRRIEPADSYPNPGCGEDFVFKSFSYKGKVLAGSYDRYHDSGGRIPLADQRIIEGMHSAYVGRKVQCKRSDETTGDSWAGRSNRGQFSFTEGVVDARLTSQFIAAIRVPYSLAGQTYSNRNVEVRRYQTKANNIACVAFTLTVAQPNFFLRINDLERVGPEPSRERGDESRWNLSR